MEKIPTCVGIILDGNRRWAKERGLPTFEGHQKGAENIEPIVLALRDRKVEHVVVYAFSTENWNRASEEVSYLMRLLEEWLRDKVMRLVEENIRIMFVGERERFSNTLNTLIHDAETRSPKTPRTTLWVCLSYGGRAEIVHAAKTLVARKEEITEESLAQNLWTAGMPNPDLIIRPGGEKRLSNFLLWQSAYSELFFIDTYWPEMTTEDLEKILTEYGQRERRIGK